MNSFRGGEVRVNVRGILKKHGWAILLTTISLVGSAIGTTYASGWTDAKQDSASAVTQQDIASLKEQQTKTQDELGLVKQDVRELKGSVNTVINLLQRRRD